MAHCDAVLGRSSHQALIISSHADVRLHNKKAQLSVFTNNWAFSVFSLRLKVNQVCFLRAESPFYIKITFPPNACLCLSMFVHIVILNAYGFISGLSCMACLLFLFFESAFGICIGCKIYAIFNKDKIQYCPGEICKSSEKQAIQKTSKTQVLIILAYALFMLLVVYFFKDNFSQTPRELWDIFTK